MTAEHGTDLPGRSQCAVIIPAPLIYCWEKLNEPCGVKDIHSRFVYANPAYLALLALPPDFNIEGRLDSEIPAATSEFAEQFQEHDRLVEAERQRKSSLEIHPFGHDKTIRAYFFDKMPFYNSAGEVVGTTFHGRIAEHLSLEFYTESSDITSTSLVLKKPDDMFSDTEWKIIFFILKGNTQKEIAAILNLSIRYVNKRISIIFEKVNVSSTRNLIGFCHHMGWNNYIPESLLALGHMLL